MKKIGSKTTSFLREDGEPLYIVLPGPGPERHRTLALIYNDSEATPGTLTIRTAHAMCVKPVASNVIEIKGAG